MLSANLSSPTSVKAYYRYCTKANDTLVVPRWVSALFWPMLHLDGIHTVGFVRWVYELPCVDLSFKACPSGSNLFKGVPNTPVLALLL